MDNGVWRKGIVSGLLMFICLGASIAGYSAEPGCIRAHGERQIAGPEPLMHELRKVAVASGVEFFDEGDYSREKFSYIGTVKIASSKEWYVVLLATEWGEACRYTPRLLIFSSDKNYIGQYSHFSPNPTKVIGNAVYFDSDPKVGNVIKFTNDGPPKKAWIDGDVLDLYQN